MCGISIEVQDAFQQLDDLNHRSSVALRSWNKKPMVDKRSELKERHQALAKEDAVRGSPVSGACRKGKEKGKVKGKEKGQEEKGKGAGTKRQSQFRNWSDQDVSNELAIVGKQLDYFTYYMQEGKLTSGEELTRPFRTLSMFAGVLLTGFGGTWITHGACLTCDTPHDIARCSRCQGGICELHGVLLSRASQESGSAEWQGSSVACCGANLGCVDRQTQILEHEK